MATVQAAAVRQELELIKLMELVSDISPDAAKDMPPFPVYSIDPKMLTGDQLEWVNAILENITGVQAPEVTSAEVSRMTKAQMAEYINAQTREIESLTAQIDELTAPEGSPEDPDGDDEQSQGDGAEDSAEETVAPPVDDSDEDDSDDDADEDDSDEDDDI